jgi:hypothetical protein
VNLLHFAIILFVISIVILGFVSLMTSPPTPRNLSVFRRAATEADQQPRGARQNSWNVALSVALAAAVLALWMYFSPLVFGG